MLLLTAKPVIYLVNLSEKDYIRQKNKHLAKIKVCSCGVVVDSDRGGLMLIHPGIF
jgi:ribosome-binding ATPase YchF (GTP1/OBG family)